MPPIDPAQPPRIVATIVPRASTGYTVNLGVNVTHVAVMDLATGESSTTVYGAHHDTSPNTVANNIIKKVLAEDSEYFFTGFASFPLPGGRTLVTIW